MNSILNRHDSLRERFAAEGLEHPEDFAARA
jgi:hypothetical protein